MQSRRAPILVTGLPRSGTTWVARLLAQSPRTAMLGREPMNPRGGQFALGGRLTSWVRLDDRDAGLLRTLRRVYTGRDPRVFGKYGVNQRRVLTPGCRVVVKDPFALLSIHTVAEATGAVPVLVYRSAAETLSSYRRMGWTPDTEEFAALGASPVADDDVSAMAEFWSWGYARAVEALTELGATKRPYVVVSHAELTTAGVPGQNAVRGMLGLDPVEARPAEPTDVSRVDAGRLHNLDRSAAEVLAGARANVTPAEVTQLQDLTGETWERLESMRS